MFFQQIVFVNSLVLRILFLSFFVKFSNSTFKFSGMYIHFFASNILHLSFKFSLPAPDLGYCTGKFPHSTLNFSN